MTTHIPSLTIPGFVLENAPASVLLPIACGTAIGFSTRPDETKKQYNALKQPPLSPPASVFGPVWTLLYGSMGYAAHRAWTVGLSSIDPDKAVAAKHAATLYTLQLGLNLAWMPLFFSLGRPIAATVDIVALTGTVGYLTYLYSKIDTVAAVAFAPYLGWLGFATYLSAGAGYLNNWDFKGRQKAAKKE